MPDTTSVPTDSVATAPRVDRLEVIQELPRGSTGTVRKAKNARSERVVALRQFEAPQWLDDIQELLERILAEARTASTLQHRNIATLYTCGYKNFTVYMTSEFVDGSTLREAMAGRPLTLPEVLATAKQLCAALDYAHAQGIVHQNLNLSNLKLLPDGTLKILDFGLLKHRHLLSQTPIKKLENEPYLSPEEVKNKPVTKSSNLFTAATIVYELLTTRSPFAGQHLGEVDRNITEVTPNPLNMAHARVPEAVSRVVLKGLAKNPDDRFQSGKEMADALEDAMRNAPMRASVPLASATKSPSAQNIPPAIGDQTIKITPRFTTTTSAPGVKSTPVTTTTRAAAASTATTTTRRPAAAPKAAAVAGKKPYWVFAAGGLGLVILVVVGLFALRRAPAQPVNESGTTVTETPVPAQAGELTPPAEPPQPTLEVRELGGKPGKPAKNAKSTISAPVPTAVAPSVGELAIATSPAGATIEIEGQGQSWRTTQAVSTLAPGTYKITVSMAGYLSETHVVTVVAGNRVQADVHLTLAKGFLTVSSNPAGARVLIDGRDSGKASPAEFALDPAAHDIVVHKEGYLDAQTSIKLVAGQAVAYSPTLRLAGRTDNIKAVGGFGKIFGGGGSSGMARVEIRTQPKGVRILINGTEFAKTTPVDIQVEPGNYEITLQKDGYKSVHKSLTVGQGEKIRIDETLPQ